MMLVVLVMMMLYHQHCDFARGDGIRAQPSSKTGSCQPMGCIGLIFITRRGLRELTSEGELYDQKTSLRHFSPPSETTKRKLQQ